MCMVNIIACIVRKSGRAAAPRMMDDIVRSVKMKTE